MFGSRTVDTIPIPVGLNDPGDTRLHEVTIQKLAGRHEAKAKQAFFNDLIAGVQERGGARVQKDIEALFKKDPSETKAEIAKVQADPLNGYDPHTLILYGVKAWTLDMPVPIDLEARRALFDDLDDSAVEFYARAVLKLTKPSLFQNEEEAKAAQKETVADPSFA